MLDPQPARERPTDRPALLFALALASIGPSGLVPTGARAAESATPGTGGIGLAIPRASTGASAFEDLRSPSPALPCTLLVPAGAAEIEHPEALEPILAAAAERRLQVVIRLLEEGWRAGVAPGGAAASSREPLNMANWTARLGRLVRQAGDRVAAWQLFDAPTAALAPRDYAYLLKNTAVAIRSARPGARIVLGTAGSGDTAWLEELLSGDVTLYFDVIAARDPASLRTVSDLASRLAPRAEIWVADAPIDPLAPAASVAAAYLESVAGGASTVIFAAPGQPPAEGGSAVQTPLGRHLSTLRALFPPGLSATTAAALPFDLAAGLALPLTFFDPGRQEGMMAYRAAPAAEGAGAAPAPGVEGASGPPADEGSEAPPGTVRLKVRTPLEWVDLIDPLDGAFRRIAQEVRRGAVLGVAARPEYLVLRYRFMATPPAVQEQVGAMSELSAEEIIALERVTRAAQEARLDHYEADANIAIHYRITGLNESVDVVTDNRLYVQKGREDYEQTDMFVNGARWRGKSPPHLPFLQPEKVKELPLDIALDEGYRYALLGRDRVDGRDCYLLSFDPIDTRRSLYQGKVHIDAALFTRVRMEAVQNGLKEPLRSNQVIYRFRPIASPQGDFWLPVSVSGQMIFEVLGQNLVVEREATYSNFRINQEGFRHRVEEAQASGRPIFRETKEGYFRVDARGGEESLTSASSPRNVFLVMGTSIGIGGDPGLPFAGVNFFDFDYKGTGTQLDVAWAGPFADISWTQPNLLRSREAGRPWALKLQGSFSALARSDKIARDSGTNSREKLDVYRESVSAALAIPMGHFAKWSLEGRATYVRFDASSATDETFVLPPDMVEGTTMLRLEYARAGYTLAAWGEAGQRSRWKEWGIPGTTFTPSLPFSPDDRDFTRTGVELQKSFYYSTFRKASLGIQGFDGRSLDRFSRFQLGDFRSARVNGFNSSGIHFDRGLVARGAYSLTLGGTLRVEAGISEGWIQSRDDFGPGYERVIGGEIGLQFSSFWSTLCSVSASRGLTSTIEGKGGGSGDIRIVFFRTFDRWSRRPQPKPSAPAVPSGSP